MMFTLHKHFIRFQDKLYEVVQHFPEHTVQDVDGLKDFLNTSIALRKDNRLFFCNEVEEAVLS